MDPSCRDTPTRAATNTAAELLALHGEGAEGAAVKVKPATATELLQALHFVPYAYRGSKWSGLVHMRISRSFSIGILVDGETAAVSYRAPEADGAETYLVLEAERDALMCMLEGSVTVAMLILSGTMHVDNWENALLFQEAFAFDPKAYESWKDKQQHVLLRPRHSDEPTQLAGGDDVDEDVEAALQHVWSERARQEAPASSSTTYVLSSLLCCSARKAE
jgi:hypothetical protein